MMNNASLEDSIDGQLPALTTSIESATRPSWAVPLWFWIVFAGLAVTFAIWIYWSERGRAGLRIRSLLAAIRFALLLLVLWMLSGWNAYRYQTERPELAVVVDRSASMNTRDIGTATANVDSAAQQSRWEATQQLLLNLPTSVERRILEDYQLRYYAVADAVEATEDLFEQETFEQLGPNGAQSKLGESLTQIVERHAGRGAAGIVFISDGINTAGASLQRAERAAKAAAIPIYPLLIGRNLSLPDVRLTDLLMDREVYFGDRVNAEVALVVSDIEPTEIKVSLRDATTNQELDSKQVSVTENGRSMVNLSFIPERAGEMQLQIKAGSVQGESDLNNNLLTQRLNVQDKTLKILLVQQQPSYEFRFLKHLLERSQEAGGAAAASFELLSVLQESDAEYVQQDASALRLVPSDSALLKQVDVFVFGNLDPELISRKSQRAIFDAVTEEGAGCVFVDGSGSPANTLAGWPLGDLLPVEQSIDNRGTRVWDQPVHWQPTSLGLSALPLQLEDSPQKSIQTWQQLPGFHRLSHFGELKLGAQVLAIASVNDDAVPLPLLISQYAGAGRVALQATDETFRWTSYRGSDVYHQRYWGQLLRWLSRGKLKPSVENSELLIEPTQAKLGQPIRVEATIGLEIPDEAMPDEAIVSLTDPQQNRRSLTLRPSSESGRKFIGSTDQLGPGTYRGLLVQPATASPPSQEFTIVAPPGEQVNLKADVAAMQALAASSRGKFYTLQDADRLFRELPPGRPTRLDALPPQPLWNQWWVALLFVGLLTSEWMLRRKARML